MTQWCSDATHFVISLRHSTMYVSCHQFDHDHMNFCDRIYIMMTARAYTMIKGGLNGHTHFVGIHGWQATAPPHNSAQLRSHLLCCEDLTLRFRVLVGGSHEHQNCALLFAAAIRRTAIRDGCAPRSPPPRVCPLAAL